MTEFRAAWAQFVLDAAYWQRTKWRARSESYRSRATVFQQDTTEIRWIEPADDAMESDAPSSMPDAPDLA